MGLITPLIGLVATLAPTIGPTVGGYLTDTLSWHLAILHQRRARHRGDDRGPDADRLRQAGLFAVREFRYRRFPGNGRLPRRARVRVGGGAAQRLVRRRDSAAARLGVGHLGDHLLHARPDRTP